MTTTELLQKAIDYIEENLTCELIPSDIASMLGFSTYHFYHIFSNFIGMPISAYITKRRLYHAIYAIQNNLKVTDAAFLYGFDTHAGFYKAFKREFGCSPSKFLKLNTAKIPEIVNLSLEVKIMLTNTKIRELLSNWDVNPKLAIGPTYCAGGAMQSKDTWTIGEEFIFKTGNDIARLRTHITILKALSKAGLSSSYPITTKNGEDFIVEEDRYYLLTTKLSGEFLSPKSRYVEDRIAISRKYGIAIGNLHKVLKRYNTEIDVNDTNLLTTVLDWALPETKKALQQWGCPLPEEFYTDYIETFTRLYPKLPRQIIHRDANASNIMFHNGEVSGFIDFSISERNVRLFDPCYCATSILSEAMEVNNSFDKWAEILQGILSGYNEICHLSAIEKDAIPYVIYSIQMIFIAWLVDHAPYKDCALQNRKMLLWIFENKSTCFKKI